MKLFRTISVVTGAAACLLLAGCAGNGRPANQPDLIVMMVDTSGLAGTAGNRAVEVLNRITAYAHQSRVPVELWGFSSDAQCFYTAQAPGSDTDLVAAESNHMSGLGSGLSKTRPALALERLLADKAFQNAARPSVVLFTNGNNDYKQDVSSFQSDAAKVAGHAGVRVVVDGLTAANKDVWMRAFRMLPPGRFNAYQDLAADRDYRKVVGLN